MAVTVADLISRLRFDTSDFTAGVERVERETKRVQVQFRETDAAAKTSFGGVRTAWQGVAEAFLGFSLANVVAQSVGALKQFALETSKLGLEARQQEGAFAAVTKAAGVAGDVLVEQMQRASGGILNVSDVMQAASKSLIQGLQPEEIVRLMEIARAGAKVMGTDVSEAFNRISESLAAGNTRAIKQLTGYIDVEAASAKYARALGREADTLTDTERIKVLFNAVNERTRDTVAALSDATLTQNEQVQQTAGEWKQFKEDLGKVLNDAFVPLVSTLVAYLIPGLRALGKVGVAVGTGLAVVFTGLMVPFTTVGTFLGSLVSDLAEGKLPSFSTALKAAEATLEDSARSIDAYTTVAREAVASLGEVTAAQTKTTEAVSAGKNALAASTPNLEKYAKALDDLNEKLRQAGLTPRAAEVAALTAAFAKAPPEIRAKANAIANLIVNEKDLAAAEAVTIDQLKEEADRLAALPLVDAARDAATAAAAAMAFGTELGDLERATHDMGTELSRDAQRVADLTETVLGLEAELAGETDAFGAVGKAADLARTAQQLFRRSLAELDVQERDVVERTVAARRATEALTVASQLAALGLDRERAASVANAAQQQADRAKLTATAFASLAQIDAASKQDALEAAAVRALRAREDQSYFGWLGASFSLAAAQAKTTYESMSDAVGSFAGGARSALSEGLFEFFKTGVFDAEQVFLGFLDSMLRAISDFLAAEAVRGLLGLAGSVFHAARGGIVPGVGPDTVPAMLSPGELVLTTEQSGLFLRLIDQIAGTHLADAAGEGVTGALTPIIGKLLGAAAGQNFKLGGLGGLLFGLPAQEAGGVLAGTTTVIRPATAGLLPGTLGGQNALGYGLSDITSSIGGLGSIAGFLLAMGGGSGMQGIGATLGLGVGGLLAGAGMGGVGAIAGAVIAVLFSMLDAHANDWVVRDQQRYGVAQSTLSAVTAALDSAQDLGGLRRSVAGDGRVGDLIASIIADNLRGGLDRTPHLWSPNPDLADAAVALALRGYVPNLSAGGFARGRVGSIGELIAATGGIIPDRPWEGVFAWETVVNEVARRATGRAPRRTQRSPIETGLFGQITSGVVQGIPATGGYGMSAEFLLGSGDVGPNMQGLAALRFAKMFFPGAVAGIEAPAWVTDPEAWRAIDAAAASAAEGGLLRVHDGEVVVPRPFADEFRDAAAALRPGADARAAGARGDLTVVLQVDGRELARTVVREFRQRTTAGARFLATDATYERKRT